MIEVALYGKPSSRYEHLKLILSNKLDEAGVDIRLTEINDVETFIKDNVHSIPAVRLNNKMYFECPEDIDIDEFTDDVIKNILLDNDSRMMKIIVPVDFSEPASNAIEYAISLANLSNVGIHITHAFHPTPVQVNGAVWVDPDAAKNSEKQLKHLVDDVIKRHPNVAISSSLEYGFPVDTLIKLSQAPDTKYIVMGSLGSNNTIRQLFGSYLKKDRIRNRQSNPGRRRFANGPSTGQTGQSKDSHRPRQ
jgi:nucleotide-binding universal stress UspA family protein